jgi:hypothetical protein
MNESMIKINEITDVGDEGGANALFLMRKFLLLLKINQ